MQHPTMTPPVLMADFPQRLRELRQQRQLTQIRVAELVGVGIRVYHRWENGNATPHFDALLRLADVLDISLDELTGREPVNDDSTIHNRELHQLVRQVDQLSDDDQRALIAVMDGLVKRTQVSRVMADKATSSRRRRSSARASG
jgi:transcriptional regulator with XRE-family HTH domain